MRPRRWLRACLASWTLLAAGLLAPCGCQFGDKADPLPEQTYISVSYWSRGTWLFNVKLVLRDRGGSITADYPARDDEGSAGRDITEEAKRGWRPEDDAGTGDAGVWEPEPPPAYQRVLTPVEHAWMLDRLAAQALFEAMIIPHVGGEECYRRVFTGYSFQWNVGYEPGALRRIVPLRGWYCHSFGAPPPPLAIEFFDAVRAAAFASGVPEEHLPPFEAP